MEAWQLLSQVYQKKRDFGRAAEAELAIYREFPDREEGYESLLSAARCYVKMGDYSRAKNLLVEITENSFFPRVNKQANIELAQIQFLTEKPEEILEN
jgi:TolA-binding protein